MKISWSTYSKDPMVLGGVKLLAEIKSCGYDAYVVGGSVRDIVMGSSDIHDIDIATNMPIDVIKGKWKTIEYGGGERHGTVIVHEHGHDYELTQFRADGDYSDGRRPDSVTFVKSFYEDTKRRDFTINAMGIDCDGELIDYHGGIVDITASVLRTVGSAHDRFTEDSLRILRAVRFAARFGFDLDAQSRDAMIALGHTVRNASCERIRDEITKIISYGSVAFAYALELMNSIGLFEVVFPGVSYNKIICGWIHALSLPSDRLQREIAMLYMVCMQQDNFDDIQTSLRLDNRVVSGMDYIRKMTPVYVNNTYARGADLFTLMTHRDFNVLCSVHEACTGLRCEDMIGWVDIQFLTDINQLGGCVSELMKECGVTPGKKFGITQRAIMDELYAGVEIPNRDTLRRIVTEFITKDTNG